MTPRFTAITSQRLAMACFKLRQAISLKRASSISLTKQQGLKAKMWKEISPTQIFIRNRHY
jgi:hypothetical protein